jgi:hypothetical protein
MTSRSFSLARKRRDEEDGAVAIVVAISLLVMMGVAALAIDAGRAYMKRSNAQNAADHAALAAAWADCSTGEDPYAAGEGSAARNGFDQADARFDVVIDELEASGGQDNSVWSTTVEVRMRTVFARLLSTESEIMNVSARAEAGCVLGMQQEEFAMFTSGDCDDEWKSIDFSGEYQRVEGHVHTNGTLYLGDEGNSFSLGAPEDDPSRIDARAIDIQGDENYFRAIGRYDDVNGYYDDDGDDNVWDPSEDNPSPGFESIDGWPVDYSMDDYVPNGTYDTDPTAAYHSAGNQPITESWLTSNGHLSGNEITPAIYYTTDEIDLPEGITGRATFVVNSASHNAINLQADNANLEAYHQGLLFYTEHGGACDQEGIELSGNDNVFRGTFYAPTGMIEVGGEGNRVYGGLISVTIQFSGRDEWVIFPPEGPATEPRARLLR